MRFDNQKSISYAADAPSFSAVILPGVNVWTATLTYKAGWKAGPPSVTTRDQDALLAALIKQDAGCKFYKRNADAGTLSAKDAAMLAQLRDDPHTSDVAYRSACKSFGAKPEPRTVNTAVVASTANLPQGAPSLRASAESWAAFETAHGELFQPPYGLLNLRVIEQYFADEKIQWTADTLATCYRELKAANCFRDARTLTRGMHGDLQVVKPYSHERILALRQKQVVQTANAAPAELSEADTAAWNTTVQNYPKVPVGSPQFRELCSRQVLDWAKENVLSADASLAASNKRGELRAAIDKQLLAWARPKKQSLSQRIWLG
jgi:hypothetical protein